MKKRISKIVKAFIFVVFATSGLTSSAEVELKDPGDCPWYGWSCGWLLTCSYQTECACGINMEKSCDFFGYERPTTKTD